MKYNVARVAQCDSTSCASANYTMVANALNLPVGLRDILRVTHGTLGQAQFWNYLLDKGAKIKCISKNDYRSWAAGGADEWSKKTPEWVYRFFAERSNDKLRSTTALFRKIFKNKNFDFTHRAPSADDLQKLFDDGYALEVMGDGWLMYGDKPKEQLLHRVFITDIDKNVVFFHDPASDGESNHRAKMSDIMAALSVDGAEVVGYKIKDKI